MGFRVPRVEPTVQPAGAPDVRIGLRATPEEFGAGVARGLDAGSEVAVQIGAREKGKANLTNLDRASNFRMEEKRKLRDRWLSKKQQGALDQHTELQKEIDRIAGESGQFFGDKDRTAEVNKLYSDRWATETKRELGDYTRGEGDAFRSTHKQANLKNHLDDVALLSSDPRAVADTVNFMTTFLANHGRADGKPGAVIQAEITDMTRASYRAAIENRLSVEDWDGAKAYVEGKGIATLIPPGLMAKYEEMIENGNLTQTARDEVDIRMGDLSEENDPLGLSHGGFSVDNEVQFRTDVRELHKNNPDLANEIIKQGTPFFKEQRAAADSRKSTFIQDAIGQMNDGMTADAASRNAPAEVRNILRTYGANRSSRRSTKAGRHSRDAETLSEVRQLIGNGFRGLPKGDGAVPEAITEVGELIPLIANLSKDDQDAAIKYLNEGGFLGVDLHTMITKAGKTFFRTRVVSPKRLADLYDEVAARLDPAVKPTQGAVDNIVHTLAVRGHILIPGSPRKKATGLDAAQLGQLDLFLPGSITGERELSDSETTRIRLQMIARGLNPDPAGEKEPTDAERNFKRQLLGLPPLGVSETNRANFLTREAAQNIEFRLKSEQAENFLRAVVGEQGFSDMSSELLEKAESGREPTWMVDTLSVAGLLGQYNTGRLNIEGDPEATADDIEDYIRRQGLLMLQGVRP